MAVDNKNFCVYNYRAKVFVDFFSMLCYYVASLNIIACEGGIDNAGGTYAWELCRASGTA